MVFFLLLDVLFLCGIIFSYFFILLFFKIDYRLERGFVSFGMILISVCKFFSCFSLLLSVFVFGFVFRFFVFVLGSFYLDIFDLSNVGEVDMITSSYVVNLVLFCEVLLARVGSSVYFKFDFFK